MTKVPLVDHDGLSEEQIQRVDRFEMDYNAVDALLRKAMSLERNSVGFTDVVKQYADSHRAWNDREHLLLVAQVRNAIVHLKSNRVRYVAVPTPTIAKALSDSRARFESPKLVLPRMKRIVKRVDVADTLSRILKLIATEDFSQFPVFEDAEFVGLLTENGITRWLASHVSANATIVEFDDVSVRTLLASEEHKVNYEFVSRDELLDELPLRFADNPTLEAVFITETGKQSEKFLGIATRWDCLQLKKAG